ncbi:uncharacterized protein TNCV_4086111 [Trichonephila clavipes]|nr:uncharacterized protein TNCV_4086111 [Trichonephila clavipes]
MSNPPHQQSSRKTRMEAVRTKETRISTHRGHSAAEGRPIRSRRKPTVCVRPCPYYLRSRFKEPEGLPEEQRNTGIYNLPQNSLSWWLCWRRMHINNPLAAHLVISTGNVDVAKFAEPAISTVAVRSGCLCKLSPSDMYLKMNNTPRKRTRILTLSQHASMTVRDFAPAVGVGKSSVSRIINQ